MVPGWVALAAWLVAWTVLASLSMGFLAKVRPGERAPLLLKNDGSAGWFVSPVVAAGLLPVFSLVAGLVTLVAAYLFSRGQAPIMNVFLPAVFVFTHAAYVRRAVAWLEKQRG